MPKAAKECHQREGDAKMACRFICIVSVGEEMVNK
jgi:hypothetical protein